MAKKKEKPAQEPDENQEPQEPQEQTEIVNVEPAPKGRIEKRIDELEIKIDGLKEELKGIGEIFVRDENPAEQPEETKADNGQPEKNNDTRYPRLDF